MHNARETHSGRCLFGKFTAARDRYRSELLKAVRTLEQGEPKRRRNRLSRLRRKRRRHENRVSDLVAKAAGAASQAKSERQRSTKLAKLVKWAGKNLNPAPLKEMLEVAGAAVQHRLLPPALHSEGLAAVSAGGRALRNLGTIKEKLCQSTTDPFFEFSSKHVKRCFRQFAVIKGYRYSGNGTFIGPGSRIYDGLRSDFGSLEEAVLCSFRHASEGAFQLTRTELPMLRGLRPQAMGLPAVPPVFTRDDLGKSASADYLRTILRMGNEPAPYHLVTRRFLDRLALSLPSCQMDSSDSLVGPPELRGDCDLYAALHGSSGVLTQGYILADGSYHSGSRRQWVRTLGGLAGTLLERVGEAVCREPTDPATVELANHVSLTNKTHLIGVMFKGEPFGPGLSRPLLDVYSTCRVTSQKVTSPLNVVIALLTAVLFLVYSLLAKPVSNR